MSIDRSFNLWNWMDAPFNRQAFQHMREFVPTAQIARADREPSPLPRDRSAQGSLDSVSFDSRHGHPTTWATHLADSWCDAICVVHDGHIIDERYLNGMHEQRLHLLMSVSKSFCGAALGVAIGQGKLVVDDLVTDLAPEFAGTSLEGATIRHVIDMTAGTDFDEDYDLYDHAANEQAGHDRIAEASPLIEYETHAGYRPLGGRHPMGTLGHFRTYGTAFAHGAKFQYRSVLTNVVARVLEVVNDLPYAQIVERDLWGPLGMEHDADIMLDPLRNPVVEGGMSCTLRDLARLGVAYLDDGAIGGEQVIPAAWVRDTRHGDDAGIAAFAAQSDGERWSMYRNGFWVMQRDEEFSGLGIFGQYCWVHRPSRTVIARFSTYPKALPEDVAEETMRGFTAVAEHLGAP